MSDKTTKFRYTLQHFVAVHKLGIKSVKLRTWLTKNLPVVNIIMWLNRITKAERMIQ